ncbi:MAG: hypothetical protein EBU46_00105 [Nitrosomonadaceae bacterium]|nr:hypothetical protein [Nitrosomonadaceae bacterium]
MSYRCAWGCTSYDPTCDMCDSNVSDQTTGWAEPKEITEQRFKAAVKGKTLAEYLIEEED